MPRVYVKLEPRKSGKHQRSCFVVDTARNAKQVDKAIRRFIRPGIMLTCLYRSGAAKYGWDVDAER